jgi:hypothetical protein
MNEKYVPIIIMNKIDEDQTLMTTITYLAIEETVIGRHVNTLTTKSNNSIIQVVIKVNSAKLSQIESVIADTETSALSLILKQKSQFRYLILKTKIPITSSTTIKLFGVPSLKSKL